MAASKDREAILRIIERHAELDGRFRNIRRLGPEGGHGHFSILFQAFDLATGKDVALKFYDPLLTFAPDAAYRFGSFEREARILQELSGERDIIGWVSPISRFTQKFDAGGISLDLPFSYFALELAKSDLASLIHAGGITPQQMLDWYHPMCRSIRRLHQLGYTHRDLKPSNFLLMADGSVRLSDFGTAKHLNAATAPLSGSYVYPPGDLVYASPEILAALLDDDPSLALTADVFALGSVLFEMVTGTVLGLHLFDMRYRDDLTQMMAAIKKGKRKEMFDRLIPEISNNHPLPNLFTFAPTVPLSILRESHGTLPFRNLAHLYSLQDKYQEALNVLRRCTDIFGDDEYTVLARSFNRSHIGDHEGAIVDLESLVSAGTNNKAVYDGLTWIIAEVKHDYGRALSILERAYPGFSGDASFINNLAYVHLMLGHTQIARTLLTDEVIGKNETNIALTATRGLLALREGNHHEARELYRSAAALASQLGSKKLADTVKQKMHLEFANEALKAGDVVTALREANQGIETGKGRTDYHSDLVALKQRILAQETRN
jgi:serine/threonine protein kinase